MKISHYFLELLLAIVFFSCKTDAAQQERIPELGTLRDSIKQQVYKDVNAIVVYQKGEILVEEYYNGTSKNDIHDARSVGKSVASALLGIAIDEGHIESLDQPISDFYNLEDYENYHRQKGAIRLRDLVTMTSNFAGDDNDFDSPGNEEYMYDQDDWVKWALNLPLDSTRQSGERWKYFTAGAVLIGDILNQSLPNGLREYAEKKLFSPLGNKNYKWAFTPQGVPSTAGNFRTTAIGFADFGQLYLNGGTWKDQSIISKKWIDESLKIQVKTSFEPNFYGYFWWIKDLTSNDTAYRLEYCSGNGGNKIYLIKELDVVVVILASAYNTNYGHPQAREIMSQFLLPIIRRESGK
ncbi:MAG: serine hydrolase [Bacteroidota bacterium]